VMDFKTCPNPSGNDFEVRYTVPGMPGDVTSVSICVYDVEGRLVRLLLDRIDSAGHRRVSWDGTLSDGSAVPSGIYFVRMSAGEASLVKKIAFVR
jgi:flagellar hook assembly protein FlgD